MRNKKLISKLSNWLDWMTFEGHQTWHFLKQIMQSEEFPYLLSTHLLKQVWVILNGKNNKRLAKCIIMQTTNLIKQMQSDSTLYLLTTANNIKASKSRETYLLNNSTLYSISFSAIPNICSITTWIIETHPKTRKTK